MKKKRSFKKILAITASSYIALSVIYAIYNHQLAYMPNSMIREAVEKLSPTTNSNGEPMVDWDYLLFTESQKEMRLKNYSNEYSFISSSWNSVKVNKIKNSCATINLKSKNARKILDECKAVMIAMYPGYLMESKLTCEHPDNAKKSFCLINTYYTRN